MLMGCVQEALILLLLADFRKFFRCALVNVVHNHTTANHLVCLSGPISGYSGHKTTHILDVGLLLTRHLQIFGLGFRCTDGVCKAFSHLLFVHSDFMQPVFQPRICNHNIVFHTFSCHFVSALTKSCLAIILCCKAIRTQRQPFCPKRALCHQVT